MTDLEIIRKISDFLWGYPVLILMLGGGLFLSVRLGFPQIHIIKILRKTLKTILCDKDTGNGISQLQGFSTALAATVGTGSVVGVGAAIFVGGKGAVFWMWISAFIGMGVSYCENFLGVKYAGHGKGGAMSYLERIGKGKTLAILYAGFSVLSSLGMGNMAQASCVVNAAESGFSVSPFITAVVLIFFTSLTAMGKNFTAKICERLVPFMAVFFCVGSLYIIVSNPSASIRAVKEICSDAFNFNSALGGAVGTVCLEGIKRGAFSNESGLGSTVAVHSSCHIKSAQVQGIMGMAEVFIDTIVICTLTALVIIISGVDFSHDCAVKAYTVAIEGIGGIFISFSLILFALATIAGWYFIGEKSWQYIFPKSRILYACISVVCVFIGGIYSPETVWGISDIFNALMAIPNMTGVILLCREIKPPRFRPERVG